MGYVCRLAGIVMTTAGLTALMASSAAGLSIQLRWSAVANAAGYKVYQRQIGQGYGSGVNVGLIAPSGGVVSYVAGSILADVTTVFAVTAYDASGRESPQSNELALLPISSGPTPTPISTATATRTVSGPAPTVPVATATRTRTRTPTGATATRTATASRTPTATPRPRTSTTLGLTGIGTVADSYDSNYLNGSLVSTSSGGLIASMSAYVGPVDSESGNRKFQMAIYTNNGGRPGTLVAKTAMGALVANAWNTLPITASLQANASYWLMYNTNGRSSAVNNLRYITGPHGYGAYSSNGVDFGTWPGTFPAATVTNSVYSLYASFGP
jgi:hypothetical protein